LDISRCGYGYGGYNDNITDAGIISLASGCPQLQSLNIGDCRNITDEGIRALARGLPQLQFLNFSDCRNI
jgi:EIN3-binding F-box protein